MVTLIAAAAWADPAALRPVGEPTWAAVVGTGSASVATGGALGAGLDFGWDGRATGAWVGGRTSTSGRWRLEGGTAVGVVLAPYGPTLALGVTPWVGVATGGDQAAFAARAVSASAFALSGARLPLTAELVAGRRFGRVWLAPRLGGGAVITPGLDRAVAVDLGLLIAAR